MAKNGFSSKGFTIKVISIMVIPIALMTQIPGPSGQPVIRLNDLNPLSGISISSSLVRIKRQMNAYYVSVKQFLTGQKVTGRETVIVYRIKDEHGNWLYSSEKPQSGHYESVDVTDRSTPLSVPDSELSEVLAENARKEKTDKTQASGLPLTTLPLSQVGKMVDEIKAHDQKMRDRSAELDGI
ncbi:MAG: hypothetical protein OXE99_15495 [Cellvibrionales bacterium]|nr:hypothetical protein [Cellvibrionales bacterium]